MGRLARTRRLDIRIAVSALCGAVPAPPSHPCDVLHLANPAGRYRTDGFLRDKSRNAWLGRRVRLQNRLFVAARLAGEDRRTIAALQRLEFAHACPAIHCTASCHTRFCGRRNAACSRIAARSRRLAIGVERAAEAATAQTHTPRRERATTAPRRCQRPSYRSGGGLRHLRGRQVLGRPLARNRGRNGRIDQRHSPRGEPGHSPEAGESAHPPADDPPADHPRPITRPITHRHRMATTCHPHRMPHIPHSRTLHMPRMRRRLRGIMGRTPAPGIRRIRMRLGMQRRTASCTRLPRKARRQAHSIWR